MAKNLSVSMSAQLGIDRNAYSFSIHSPCLCREHSFFDYILRKQGPKELVRCTTPPLQVALDWVSFHRYSSYTFPVFCSNNWRHKLTFHRHRIVSLVREAYTRMTHKLLLT